MCGFPLTNITILNTRESRLPKLRGKRAQASAITATNEPPCRLTSLGLTIHKAAHTNRRFRGKDGVTAPDHMRLFHLRTVKSTQAQLQKRETSFTNGASAPRLTHSSVPQLMVSVRSPQNNPQLVRGVFNTTPRQT